MAEDTGMTIRSLFDPNRNIDRNIEKVIAFGALDPRRLKAEITEYVVTDKIEDQFHTLLSRMQLAMETGGENEIGVWVSGFYGSGKSSFTKYLGLAFDSRCAIEGTPFLKYLQDRLNKVQTRQLLSTVAQRFPAAVVMLDLASEMLAGATMADVTTVLYFKVLKWAGYSDNLTLAALERQTEKDGKRAELDAFVASKFAGKVWADVHNDPLAVSALAPLVAHQLYPELFPTANAFTGDFKGWLKSQDQQVQEMLDIVREKSGKQHIVFVVDEVGQYVASRDNLILEPGRPGEEPQAPRPRQSVDHCDCAADAHGRRPACEPELATALQAQGPIPDSDRPRIERHQGNLLSTAAGQVTGRRRQPRQAIRCARPGAAAKHQARRREVLRGQLQSRELHQSVSVPAGALRHPAASARGAGQVHRRHRAAFRDQGHSGRPERG